MSYGRKCLCCLRTRQQRHFFFVLDDGGGMRLSVVCSDCASGKTPEKLMPKEAARKPVTASDGLWRGPVSREPLRASL